MNGYRTLCEVNSVSRVQELVSHIAEKIGLLDSTGYSIYVTLHTKVGLISLLLYPIAWGHIFRLLSENGISTQSQSGFIPVDSTTNQLTIIYDNQRSDEYRLLID